MQVPPHMGEVDNINFLVEKWDKMVRRRDVRTARQVLIDDTKKPILLCDVPGRGGTASDAPLRQVRHVHEGSVGHS